jgi:hypothetical protein
MSYRKLWMLLGIAAIVAASVGCGDTAKSAGTDQATATTQPSKTTDDPAKPTDPPVDPAVKSNAVPATDGLTKPTTAPTDAPTGVAPGEAGPHAGSPGVVKNPARSNAMAPKPGG